MLFERKNEKRTEINPLDQFGNRCHCDAVDVDTKNIRNSGIVAALDHCHLRFVNYRVLFRGL